MGKRSLEESITEDVSMTEGGEGPTTEKDEYEYLCTLVNAIAQPLAGRKLAKKVYKLAKKSAKTEKNICQGMREVQKAMRKNQKGMLIMAGNVTPIDIYSHLAGICEEKEIPYVYTPSREHLGLAIGQRRPCVVIFIKPHADYQELYDEVVDAANKIVVE